MTHPMRRLLPLSLLLALFAVAASPAAAAREGLFRGFKAGTTDAGHAVTLRVAKRGRSLSVFRAKMAVACPDGTTIPIEVEERNVRVAPKGSFRFGYAVSGVGDAGARGRITGGRASGTVEYDNGACAGSMRWTAARVAR